MEAVHRTHRSTSFPTTHADILQFRCHRAKPWGREVLCPEKDHLLINVVEAYSGYSEGCEDDMQIIRLSRDLEDALVEYSQWFKDVGAYCDDPDILYCKRRDHLVRRNGITVGTCVS